MNRLQVEDDLFDRSGDYVGRPVLRSCGQRPPRFIAMSAKGNGAGLMLRALAGHSFRPLSLRGGVA